ncbi:fructose-bisphosphate aldolase [Heliobacterium gestii]|uniref:2-amino-3,7-dideoxy-D-threo-hept-6-ulosonate synthase n=1 Tax=Heliomicrobium gestii TaxID=2699 RepID=A0A845L788_HELGE|nr:2-amino-3,7-dideoxy-D-threo-hept-6-ulosonate synthase [Heliomicrobium gestii]MBM7866192.1 putative phospho-2-dehydro-3-deoxyheptonate aldolase [Heliomicrobium gestii]MZP42482.1 fructose-bisphosphate aldolase [Heliomicrobium gestii]
MTGKAIRLNRLFAPSGQLLAVPLDHGVTLGPLEGLTEIHNLVKAVTAGGADAVIVHKGLARQIAGVLSSGQCDLIVHLSASTALSPEPNHKEVVSSVEHAVRLGATAVSVHVNLGAATENKMLEDLGRVADACELWGMPLLAMMYVRDGKPASEYDPVKVAHAARVAEELGADIVKVNYTGSPESFMTVTGGIRIPVLIAGGPKTASTGELLTMIYEAQQAGSLGVAIGRNIFQHAHPLQLTAAIRRILDGKTEASQLAKLASSVDDQH